MKETKISIDDFSIEVIGDNELIDLMSGGENNTNEVELFTSTVDCWDWTVNASVTIALTTAFSTAKCSNPANTFTELGCC